MQTATTITIATFAFVEDPERSAIVGVVSYATLYRQPNGTTTRVEQGGAPVWTRGQLLGLLLAPVVDGIVDCGSRLIQLVGDLRQRGAITADVAEAVAERLVPLDLLLMPFVPLTANDFVLGAEYNIPAPAPGGASNFSTQRQLARQSVEEGDYWGALDHLEWSADLWTEVIATGVAKPGWTYRFQTIDAPAVLRRRFKNPDFGKNGGIWRYLVPTDAWWERLASCHAHRRRLTGNA